MGRSDHDLHRQLQATDTKVSTNSEVTISPSVRWSRDRITARCVCAEHCDVTVKLNCDFLDVIILSRGVSRALHLF